MRLGLRRGTNVGCADGSVTAIDIKSIVISSATFGIFNALSAPVLMFKVVTPPYLVWRLMLLSLWKWINPLPLCINYHRKVKDRKVEYIQDDRVNKSWRLLPPGPLTITRA